MRAPRSRRHATRPLATLPGANAISVHASPIWTLVVITAESDEAVRALGVMLGLDMSEVDVIAVRARAAVAVTTLPAQCLRQQRTPRASAQRRDQWP